MTWGLTSSPSASQGSSIFLSKLGNVMFFPGFGCLGSFQPLLLQQVVLWFVPPVTER